VYNSQRHQEARYVPVSGLQEVPATARKGVRSQTLADYNKAVARVIQIMRERFDEQLSLRDLSEIALFSPYHFDRMFRHVTGVSPFRFLTAIRMEAAKRLLLTTKLRVTDVCYEVGYRSLGTFSAHFTQVVGLPPSSLRYLRRLLSSASQAEVASRPSDGPDLAARADPAAGIAGAISAPDEFVGLVFVGAFQKPIPQTRPEGCALLAGPGRFLITGLPEGAYYLFAAGLPRTKNLETLLMPDATSLWIGTSVRPIAVRGRAAPWVEVELRPRQVTDPPMLIALPLLLTERLGKHRGARDPH
jgi:AraC family transcriptional regulator